MIKPALTDSASASLKILLLGILILGVLAAVKWQSIQNYFDAYKNKRISTPLVSLRQINDDLAGFKYNFVLPKSKVTVAYYEAFNKTLNEILLIDSVNRNDLSPKIEEAKALIEAKNYGALSPLAAEAQKINDAQKKREVILASYLDALSVANKTITDAETGRLTEELIKAGRRLNDSYAAYSSLIDNMIAGNVNAETVAEAQTIKDSMAAAISASREASSKILTYLDGALKADIEKIKASTTTKK